MFYNRIRSDIPAQPVADPSPSPAALMAMPAQCQCQQELYAWALAQAQAVVRPSILERDLLGVWN